MPSSVTAAASEPLIGSAWIWMASIAFLLGLLVLDFSITRRPHEVGLREAVCWSVFYLALPLVFTLVLWAGFGGTSALEFFTGFVVESQVIAVHADQAPGTHAFRADLDQLVEKLPNATAHVWYEAPEGPWPADRTGLLDLTAISIPEGVTTYLCGPLPFLRAARAQLRELGVPAANIHYEAPPRSVARPELNAVAIRASPPAQAAGRRRVAVPRWSPTSTSVRRTASLHRRGRDTKSPTTIPTTSITANAVHIGIVINGTKALISTICRFSSTSTTAATTSTKLVMARGDAQ